MKDSKKGKAKKGLPAAALAGLARTAAGASWPGVLLVGAGAALLREWKKERAAPGWLLAVQGLFGAFVLNQTLVWAGTSWQGGGNETWVALILLTLALWLAKKGPEAVQAASGVLGLAEAGLLGAVLLGSAREIRAENLLPGRGLPDGWLLVTLLLPGEGQYCGWLWGGLLCLVTAGVGLNGNSAFLEMSRSVSGIGAVRRLESLCAVGLALGFFLMMAELLSRERSADRIWTSILAAGLYLSGFRVNGWIAALCAVAVWYFLPTVCEKKKR